MYAELLKIASLLGFTGKEHFHSRQVHWIIDLSEQGKPLSFSPTVALEGKRGKRFRCAKNYHMQFKDGKLQSVCTNQNNWLPDFLVVPVDEIFPRGADGKIPIGFSKRQDTWQLIKKAARDLPNNKIIQAIKRFLISRPNFQSSFSLYDTAEAADGVLKALKEGKENIGFRVAGIIACSDRELLNWWQSQVYIQREKVCEKLPIGRDLLSNTQGVLAEFFPSVLGGTPMISYNKAPYQSFGMGNQTTPMLLENAEKCAAALNALCDDPDNSLWLGGMQAVFWAANNNQFISPGLGRLMDFADPLSVKDFLDSPWQGVSRNLPNGRLYSVILKKTKGRFSVRHWQETSLSMAESNLRRWFAILTSVPDCATHQSIPSKISTLAKCTIHKSKKSKPMSRTYTGLFETAIFGKPLPFHLFVASIHRQSLELAKGCDKKTKNDFEERLRSRTALIKIYFEVNKKGELLTMENHTSQDDRAYLCGRLLALLDKIHIEAHKGSGGTNSSPANRAYTAASTNPALIFPQLCKLARHHLNKVGGGWAYCLEHGYETESGESIEGLKHLIAKFQEFNGGKFPRILSLEEQGRFAIGFYFERCRNWPKARKKLTCLDKQSFLES
jgi:CRISPR-associated protein Csd1